MIMQHTLLGYTIQLANLVGTKFGDFGQNNIFFNLVV